MLLTFKKWRNIEQCLDRIESFILGKDPDEVIGYISYVGKNIVADVNKNGNVPPDPKTHRILKLLSPDCLPLNALSSLNLNFTNSEVFSAVTGRSVFHFKVASSRTSNMFESYQNMVLLTQTLGTAYLGFYFRNIVNQYKSMAVSKNPNQKELREGLRLIRYFCIKYYFTQPIDLRKAESRALYDMIRNEMAIDKIHNEYQEQLEKMKSIVDEIQQEEINRSLHFLTYIGGSVGLASVLSSLIEENKKVDLGRISLFTKENPLLTTAVLGLISFLFLFVIINTLRKLRESK